MSAAFCFRAGACPVPEADFRAMREEDLDAVHAVELDLYPFPWTRGNFLDSLGAGYDVRVLVSGQHLLAYAVSMQIPDELHLLNLSVASSFQHRGLGRWIMLKLLEGAQAHGLASMLLEVRPSNTAGQRLYRSLGFSPIGLRRRYYPASNNTREDAIVMRRHFDA